MDNGTIITINGTDYYAPNGSTDNLVVINNRLVNFGTSSISLYSSIRTSGSTQFIPYIRVDSLTNAEIYSSQQNHQTLTVNSYSIKQQPLVYSIESIYLLFVILGVLLCQLFKR